MVKTFILTLGLLFNPMVVVAQGNPTPPVVECVTPSGVLTYLKTEPTLFVQNHKVFSGEDAKELAKLIGDVLGETPPKPYTVITATRIVAPIGLVTLFVMYDEKFCAYSRSIFSEVLMNKLRENITNSSIRFE